MHRNTKIFIRKNLLHVSTLLGHLQGEWSVTLLDALIQLSENVPLQRHILA
jgi:hypothetical protein